ncbi:Lrp/AsnC family transcriptional regulator [Natronobacterium gregoryi]|uniref:AsnC family transcriptional regulator n=2 Tax=Natronobacterium gregoryi TaxID=44930 RepID=L0AEE4_NATGS|nr:Lrp/AsnC family transcriptional regulator [Natronobacterium gregoryi]AFZ71512.1 transcriptional regulator [Natronobacterium gregoryi SP2]ELY66568.1 AsnC family transcriptional regulator [Natronobacterium gregoryi SP2]PLK21286.1 Lrp/AsnC family transcriptional regulator [Natronobacterium gregoryi SP2]SFI83068.1 DNA-binding transcriptional regulator, Lrp family [Natronobacterium gregoryi]
MSEREVLELLRENARYSTADIARMTGLEESEVEAAIEELEAAGVVRGYRAVVDLDKLEDERVRAEVELNVRLDRETGYGDIAERLARFPQVKALRLVSGDYDFDVEIEGDSIREVSQFVSEKVAPIPEITQTVTHYVMTSYKENGIEFDDGDEDDRLSISP